MGDEVADLGAKVNAGIVAERTGARLGRCRIQVSNSCGSARACVECGIDLERRDGPAGRPRVRCVACRAHQEQPRRCANCAEVLTGRGPQTRCTPCQFTARTAREAERTRRLRAEHPKWNAPRPCRFCGAEFQPRARHEHRRRACYECGLVPTRRWPCAECGVACTRRGGRCDACAQARRVRPACVCKGCGKAYVPKTRDRVSFCSRECAFSFQHEQRVAREEREAQARGVLVEGTCVQCGGWFAVGRRREICSERCRTERARLAQRAYYAENLALPRGSRECPECGESFVAPASPRFLYCSPRCCRRADKRNRKASQRQGWRSSVSRIAIVRRDRNQCGICGFRVLPDAGPAWRGTLDHIVPLSRGGLHREENVQLAHLVCNSTKCDGSRPDWRDRLDKRLRTNSPFAHVFATEVACG